MTSYVKHRGVRCPGIGRFFLVLAAGGALFACRPAERPMAIDGRAQGTTYAIRYYDPQRRDLRGQVDSLLAAFDQSASLWVDSSLLRRLNAGQTDSLDAVLAFLVERSCEMTAYTDGAFDPRVGRLVQMWGFSFLQRTEPDSAMLVDLLRASRGRVWCEGGRYRRQYDDTELDFNAIAQGYASDLVARLMDSCGIESYLIDIGGEVIARGRKADGTPWRVGIERPSADSVSAPVVETAIPLEDRAVVTSGSYRKYYEKDGVRYSHTVDPATGRPVQHSLLSVSVVDDECWRADAMATAYMVMGLDSALSFIEHHPGGPGTEAVLFIYDDGGVLRSHATPEFEALQTQKRL